MHFENFQGSSSQLLDDPKQPPAPAADTSKKMNDDRGIDKGGTEPSALQEQAPRSLEDEENLQEESKSTTTSADWPLPEENRAAGELLGSTGCEEEEANAARQREGPDDCQDPGSGWGLAQNEAEAEPSSLAKGETAGLTSAGCRRSSRRKPR